MNKLLIEYQYFGTVDYIKTLFQYSNIDFEICETYQKMSFRNRSVVVGGNGVVNLSVPLIKGRDQKTALTDIRISYDQAWQMQQWRTIVSCYNRSPYFEYYAPWLENFFQRKPVFLIDLNREITAWLWKMLKITATRGETLSFVPVGQTPDTITDRRGYFNPRTNIAEDDQIRYYQVFEDRLGFIPHLSILDLLFCEGPSAISLLASNT